jgi:hypothetical protein
MNGMKVEQPKNGQVDQRIQRRPELADAELRTTDGFFPSHALGLTGAEAAPKTRQSSLRPTLNGDHRNGSSNESTAGRGKSRPVSVWNLGELIRPLPIRKQRCQRQPKLLPHYAAVTEFVHNSRFAIASQIQRRFATYIPTERTAQYQLASLVELGYLRTAPVRSTSPNFPFVYCVTGRGVRLIRDSYAALDNAWHGTAGEGTRTRGIALPSILHELLLTEFDLAVGEGIEQRPGLERMFVERQYFRPDKQLRFEHRARKHLLIPDSGFLVRLREQGIRLPNTSARLLLHFTELDNGTMPLARLLDKLRHYDLWSRSTEGAEYLARLYKQFGSSPVQPNFRLLLIAHGNSVAGDRGRLVDTFIQALDLSSAMRDRIWITTIEALRQHEQDSDLVAATIWVRARHASPWLHAYREFERSLSDANPKRRFAERRRFVRDKLLAMAKHRLL